MARSKKYKSILCLLQVFTTLVQAACNSSLALYFRFWIHDVFPKLAHFKKAY